MKSQINLYKIMVLLSVILFADKLNAKNIDVSPDSSGYVNINGVELYYEMHGAGEPLLYLHGGLSSGADFAKYIPVLSKHYKVITVDRRGHGRSYDNGKPYSYAGMADDMNLFMEHFGIKQACVIGWSDGGVVGFHLAGKYPSRVKKLLVSGANYLVNGMREESVEWIKTQLTPENVSKAIPGIEEEYNKVNPVKGNFINFISKTREMWLRDPYFPKEDFAKITIPVLLVAGDKDGITLEHMIDMYRLIKNSQLCILPNSTHFVFNEKNEMVIAMILNFFKQ